MSENKNNKTSIAQLSTALQTQDFSVDQQYSTLRNSCLNAGAIVTFTGLVRDLAKTNKSVECIELSIYEAMSKMQLHQIGTDVFNHFDLDGVDIIHRHGKLKPTEQIVYIGVARNHNG